MSDKTIWTIGHSTHTFQEFVRMLQSFNIELVADIRNYPGSRRFPYFNKESLIETLPQQNIRYAHIKELGGRRKPVQDSLNTAWKNSAFRGYADYMESVEFKNAVLALEELALQKRTVYMCSEAVWWSCHRSLVSDDLKAKGWKVMHIMNIGKEQEHPYTSPAKIIEGKLTYRSNELF
jgi:uncharacterized protein (DUF488 family)